MENGPVTNDVLRKSSENAEVATSQTVSLPEDMANSRLVVVGKD
jgi:hypothetical protein